MSTSLPDVLDAMGKTPREFGTIHVHFEGVREVDGRRSVALVLAQAAFLPASAATVRLIEGDRELVQATLPRLDDGRVVRLSIPFVRASGEAQTFALAVEAVEPGSRAERVRQAWKLFDTFEIPKLSEMDPARSELGSVDLAGTIALSALTTPLLGAVVIRFAGSATLPANERTKVHRAIELPALTGALLAGVAPPLEAMAEEVLWRVGAPVPEVAAPAETIRPQSLVAAKTRWCRSCGFEGPAADYERARSCPRCDEPWF